MIRRRRELIPERAFREAAANALVHRTWDVNADVHIGMYDDRIEIASIGGLPFGMSREEYLRGGVSILRNPIIANVFFRLHYIEAFGTGVKRIRNAYRDSDETPSFEVLDHSIRIILPVLDRMPKMTMDEKEIYDVLKSGRMLSSSEIAQETGLSRNKVLRLLKTLMERNVIIKSGNARSTRYSRA